MKKRVIFLIVIVSALILSGCQKKKITCEEDETIKDGKCVVLLSEIDQKIVDTSELTNYTIEVSIQFKEEIANVVIAFDDEKSVFQTNNQTEYYLNENNQVYRVFESKSGYQKELISADSSQATLYDFFVDLKEDDLSKHESAYLLNYSSYDLLDDLRKSFDRNAVLSNVVVTFGDTHIKSFNFDLSTGELVYHLMMNFTNINQTVIEVPSHV
ncbi:conserved hypothetical protein [Paracholeplasma brassicae]|uniref:Lipoprotein n=1 Tax=Acholeplasma brassicae TaxID=61635 RepID=U4KR36_9MOLU|nr:hypothetical protein [Paracholeplasma brassicae]CCV65393.1 conserved hypothetical protein [Paracholeplasma brassicae]